MKKFIKAFFPLITLIFALTIWPASENIDVKAQAGAQMVFDAAANAALSQNNSTLATMTTIQTQMQEQAKLIEEIKEKVGFIQDAKVVYQMAQMMQDLICSYQGLNLAMKKNQKGMFDFCNFRAQYSIGMLNIQAASDILQMILNGGLKMDQGVRVQNMKNAIELFSKGNEQILQLNSTIMMTQARQKNNDAFSKSMDATLSIYNY